MQNPNIHKLLSAAQSLRKIDDESWTCYCPIHEGGGGIHNNSLSVLAPADGKIVVNCHNGCDPKEVIYAFGLTWTDCFPPKEIAKSNITAVYDYRDEDGILRFQVCRLEPGKEGRAKDFRQRVPDGNGGWTWKTKGLRKFPYRLQELAAGKDPVFIVEGEKQVDYLRSIGLTATCNPGGAGKWAKPYAKHFENRDVVVIPDADEPNPKTGKIVGAAHAKDVADSLIGVARSIHVIELPGCQPKWGLDDWLQKGGHTLQELSDLLRVAEAWGPESHIVTEVNPNSSPDAMADPLDKHRSILAAIGIVYCAETENSEIEIFSSVFHKFSTIKDPGKLTYSRLLQVAGHPVVLKVRQSAEDTGEFSLNDVRNAIAIVAGSGKRGAEKLGQGIWRVSDKIVLVNGGHLAILHEGKLTQEFSAVIDDQVFELQNGSEWFDFDQVAELIHQPDRSWIQSVFTDLRGILSQWCYRVPDKDVNPEICAEVTASLIVATFIQSFWTFRPMVFLLGESNSGKSTMFQLLIGDENDPLDSGLMGTLAIHSANQSAAGIRQAAESASRPVIVDEFEQGRHRKEILELLRGASRGSQTLRGTAGQKAVSTKLAFMAWAASTESGLVKQVDANRWIRIQLITPKQDRMGHLKLPNVEESAALRNRIIAAAIMIGSEARILVDALMRERPKDVDHRVCQIFAVPAAIWASMHTADFDSAVWVFGQMIRTFDQGQLEKDQESALEVILTSKIKTGHSDRSLLSILQTSHSAFAYETTANEDLLAANGIQIFQQEGRKHVFFVHKVVSRELLRTSSLEGVKIDELLLRLDGAFRDQRRVSGKPMRGVAIPMDLILPPEPTDLFAGV